VVTASDGLQIRRSTNEAYTLAVTGDNVESDVNPNLFTIDSVYPNPTSAALTVQVTKPRADLLSARLIDALGRSFDLQSPKWESAGTDSYGFDVSGMASGAYSLELKFGDSVYQKLVVIFR